MTDSAPLTDCVRASRLLGSDPYLVLHGGGNSSAKDGDVIYVKASGHDMGTIGPEGFAPLDRAALGALMKRDELTDTEMVAGLRAALLDPGSATPSIETLLHNLLPGESVLHTHADAIVTLTNSRDGTRLLADALGPDVPVLPYSKPGFDLAHLVRHEWPEIVAGDVRAFVLAHHGLFTVADAAPDAAALHRSLVDAAARAIREATSVVFEDEPDDAARVVEDDDPQLRALGDRVRAATGSPVALYALRSSQVAAFLERDDLDRITQRGPSTLEHVIRTHRVPLVGRDVEGYVAAYTAYVDRNRHRSADPLTMLDPAPRVILDPALGLVTTGRTPAQALIAQDIYRHTMRIITAAEALGGYVAVSEGQAFDIEYWELEQAKLR